MTIRFEQNDRATDDQGLLILTIDKFEDNMFISIGTEDQFTSEEEVIIDFSKQEALALANAIRAAYDIY